MQRTLVIVKPDGVGKKVAGEIIKRFETEGLKLAGLRMVRPGKQEIESFYDIHKGKPFFEPLVNFMLSGPIIVSVWQGEDAVKKVRGIIGATNSKEAAAGTLRNQYGTDNRRNLVHASDSTENATREIAFFFKPGELFEYDENNWVSK